jgi:ParB-like chromosome segregation protein Spo0J
MTAVAESPADTEAQDWPYRFEILPLDELAVDEGYQRPLTNFWETVRDNFNPALVGTLVVSERRNGSKWIIDGQTRWAAMCEQGWESYRDESGLVHNGAPCLVYEGLSKAQEAQLFALLQTQRRGMRTYHRFRAQLVAKNKQAVGIAKVVTAAGFDLGVEETRDTLQSIAALERAYKVAPDHLADVLGIIRDVWGTQDKTAVQAQMIAGLSTFVRKQERLDYDRLKDRLRDVTPQLLINRAAQIREGAGPGTGAAGSVAQAILSEYMRKKKG